jgi:hypothetical protein
VSGVHDVGQEGKAYDPVTLNLHEWLHFHAMFLLALDSRVICHAGLLGADFECRGLVGRTNWSGYNSSYSLDRRGSSFHLRNLESRWRFATFAPRALGKEESCLIVASKRENRNQSGQNVSTKVELWFLR